jgi:hypothetical protein
MLAAIHNPRGTLGAYTDLLGARRLRVLTHSTNRLS